MQFEVVSVVSKTGLATGVSVLAILAMSLAGPSRSETRADIFHHWPHFLAPMTLADADDGQDIFHHWPHVALTAADSDNHASPDIFHHWPHAG